MRAPVESGRPPIDPPRVDLRRISRRLVHAAELKASPPGGAVSLSKATLRRRLEETRARTHALVASVREEDMDRVHDALMSPLVWDLGHIAAFEDLWVCRAAGGAGLLRPDLAEVYDATETPRKRRGDLPYLRVAEAQRFMEDVRERALGVLESVDISERGDRLNAGG